MAKADDVADYVYSNLQETWRQFLAGTVLDAESLVVIESESPLNLKSGSRWCLLVETGYQCISNMGNICTDYLCWFFKLIWLADFEVKSVLLAFLLS